VTARPCPPTPPASLEAIRQLHLVRASAVKARRAALAQLGQLLVTAPATVREPIQAPSCKGKASRGRRLPVDTRRLSDPEQAARYALRILAGRSHALEGEIAALNVQLAALVQTAAPRTLALSGVGVQLRAQVLLSAGQNIDRLRSEAAFAHRCGAAPIEVGQDPPTPAQPGRGPAGQPCPAHDRRGAPALV
jgi:transposase